MENQLDTGKLTTSEITTQTSLPFDQYITKMKQQLSQPLSNSQNKKQNEQGIDQNNVQYKYKIESNMNKISDACNISPDEKLTISNTQSKILSYSKQLQQISDCIKQLVSKSSVQNNSIPNENVQQNTIETMEQEFKLDEI